MSTTRKQEGGVLVEALGSLVHIGLNRVSFPTTAVAEELAVASTDRTAEQHFELTYRAIAGAGPEASLTELPSDPRFVAARKLFGVEPGLAGASATTRRDEASRHLRARRPRDPYLEPDAPLSGRQQRLKLQTLLQQIAHDLLKLAEQPATTTSSKALYDVTAVDYTIRCDQSGCAIEKIEDWTITANQRLTHFPKTWALGNRDPAGLQLSCIGGQLAKTYDRQAGVLITEVLFGEALSPGDERTVRFVTRFIDNNETDQHLTARSTRPAQSLRVRLQLPSNTAATAAPVVQQEDYEDVMFDHLRQRLPVDSCGYAEAAFHDMLPNWNYGLAWQIGR